MPHSGCSALHGVNTKKKKKKEAGNFSNLCLLMLQKSTPLHFELLFFVSDFLNIHIFK